MQEADKTSSSPRIIYKGKLAGRRNGGMVNLLTGESKPFCDENCRESYTSSPTFFYFPRPRFVYLDHVRHWCHCLQKN